MKRIHRLTLLLLIGVITAGCHKNHKNNKTKSFTQNTGEPALSIGNPNQLQKELVFHLALGNLYTNIRLHKSGLLKKKRLCFMAGLNYNQPWTRDAAINTWNGGGLLYPRVAKHTLLSRVKKDSTGKPIIYGEYWDKMIWTVGAWNYYLYTGDKDFLSLAFKVSKRTLRQLEAAEYDSTKHLFRGAAVYGDGVAAYPKIYTHSAKGNTYSGIRSWPQNNPDLKASRGYGLPMHALSTNCLYYQVYRLLGKMAKTLDQKENPNWGGKAMRLKKAINNQFWDPEQQTYNYLVDPFGGSNAQEAIGLSFALMFGVADSARAQAILHNTHVAPAGIPVVYPSFPRYVNKQHTSYGRHSGTIWPHAQGFWAYAAAQKQAINVFTHEYNTLTRDAWHSKQFAEIYHPKTGKQYGGIQENADTTWSLTASQNIQTWSATAYLRMVLMGVAGMRFNAKGIRFSPMMPASFHSLHLKNIPYRNAVLDIFIKGKGSRIKKFIQNGNARKNPFLPANAEGRQKIKIILE